MIYSSSLEGKCIAACESGILVGESLRFNSNVNRLPFGDCLMIACIQGVQMTVFHHCIALSTIAWTDLKFLDRLLCVPCVALCGTRCMQPDTGPAYEQLQQAVLQFIQTIVNGSERWCHSFVAHSKSTGLLTMESVRQDKKPEQRLLQCASENAK